jgi:hypothetical protein
MIKATFYCDIIDDDGWIDEKNFIWDEQTFENQTQLDEYISQWGYVIGDPCFDNGDGSIGYLTEIFLDEN